MRKKLTIGFGLFVLVLLVIVVVAWWLSPTEPPLREGMTEAEVERALGSGGFKMDPWYAKDQPRLYDNHIDCFGNGGSTKVYFKDGKVVGWEYSPSPRTRPPWLNMAMKLVGWLNLPR